MSFTDKEVKILAEKYIQRCKNGMTISFILAIISAGFFGYRLIADAYISLVALTEVALFLSASGFFKRRLKHLKKNDIIPLNLRRAWKRVIYFILLGTISMLLVKYYGEPANPSPIREALMLLLSNENAVMNVMQHFMGMLRLTYIVSYIIADVWFGRLAAHYVLTHPYRIEE